MPRPDLARVPEFYHGYINQVKEDDLAAAFRNQSAEFDSFWKKIPAAKAGYRYAEGKWTIREVLQHIIDGERIFAYRALCIARRDATPLPGFDENSYAEYSKAENRDWNDLLGEWAAVRRSTEYLFNSFDEEQLETTGTASGKSNYVRAFGFIIIGHMNHHARIVAERYL